jgi:hypothetical protein
MFIPSFHMHCGCNLCAQRRREIACGIPASDSWNDPSATLIWNRLDEKPNKSEQLIQRLVKRGCLHLEEKKTLAGQIKIVVCRFCLGPMEDSEATRGHFEGCIWPELVEEMKRIGEER